MSTSNAYSSKARLLSIVLLLAVFLTGGLVGAAMSSSAFAGVAPAMTEPDTPGGLAELGLSSDQRDEIDAIMARYQPTADSIASNSIARLQSLLDQVDADVRELLTPDQLTLYDEMLIAAPQIRAVRRTRGPSGEVVVDTIGPQ